MGTNDVDIAGTGYFDGTSETDNILDENSSASSQHSFVKSILEPERAYEEESSLSNTGSKSRTTEESNNLRKRIRKAD